jgi:hypothetical protein
VSAASASSASVGLLAAALRARATAVLATPNRVHASAMVTPGTWDSFAARSSSAATGLSPRGFTARWYHASAIADAVS